MTDAVTLEVGEPAPPITTTTADGTVIDLASTLAEGQRVVLYFYPKDSTPGCTTQACDFRDNVARLAEAGLTVWGVSKDSAASHTRFSENQGLTFPLLLDQDGSLHEAYGTWRLKMNYGREYMGCSRSTFVIDTDGTIAWARYNVKAKGHVAMLLRELGLDA
jgi:peroxiredoxin Q/BCP